MAGGNVGSPTAAGAAALVAAHAPLSAPHHRHPFPGELHAYGGASCVIAAVITNPLDVAKTQLQVQGEIAARRRAAAAAATTAAASTTIAAAEQRPLGMLRTLAHLVHAEGPRALMRGVAPSMLREATYSTIRYGSYDYIKAWLQHHTRASESYARAHAAQAAAAASAGANETQAMPLGLKIAAGGAAGALGAAGATPSDLIKVRAQAAAAGGAGGGGASGGPRLGLWAAAVSIYREEGGLKGLYRGAAPTTLRAAMLTATQLPVYDHAKYVLTTTPALGGRFAEGNLLHFACSMLAGVAAATVVAPVDLVKSRMMNQGQAVAGGPAAAAVRYRSMLDCLRQTVAAEGVLALWKGWLPACARLGPHTCISLLVFEKFRHLAGLAPV